MAITAIKILKNHPPTPNLIADARLRGFGEAVCSDEVRELSSRRDTDLRENI